MDKLKEAALVVIKDCVGVKNNETVLILTDSPCTNIGKILFEVSEDFSYESFLLEIEPRKLNGEEPPVQVSNIMKEVDVVVSPLSKSITHTDARRNACENGTRVGTMPGITEDVMVRTMRADYHQIAKLTHKITEILTAGKIAYLTTPLGTDIKIPIDGIKALPSTGLVREKGQFGNLPSGESFLMPEENKAQGVFYIDASVAGVGLIKNEPIKITIIDGLAVKIEGGEEAKLFEKMVEEVGTQGRNLAELGIGTNYLAEIKGTALEDEKVLGTVHLALGNNVTMGGTVNVGFHVDGIITNPTLQIDDILILKDGKMLIDAD
jgi:leucyl aminopeptidase (aminopeptidase T)